ncbi:hypothetical protein FK004_06790 [Flavobacterium kingsejongi]|uniref:DUF4296 domain-containing protein n=2 Tax=Flavobacterium kingsejongi TaxID=1678728 RepID=A0A2S1LMV9_9FLAO|nr:hypothetical protein FK004_06790 [Flavobacterium kingsejongi]
MTVNLFQMKKILGCIIAVLFLVSCSDTPVHKPKKLIKENVMVDILYDMALLQAMKSYNPNMLDVMNINSTNYIYKKYNIDSLQFAQNNEYYASRIEDYQKIYEKVDERLQKTIKASKPKVLPELKKDVVKKAIDSTKKATDSIKLKSNDSLRKISIKKGALKKVK